ncbi:hypothetical protein EW146_g10119 [Bondarzewia mesenterica]|uniref:Uncharacterized protein n=1 Tax=Bondarzewia mesenterica TaxID=1095465 RepID=A0A4S4L084_9AGAM|nr:hypothetical protein EW146_g10119 [Bondarzewia mesenterica]
MPLLTQSDLGTENHGVANGHTTLRHLHDPSLAASLQRKFLGGHRNIKPEIAWRQVCQRWAPGFEDLLDFGVNSGLYNPDDPLERMVFHHIFILWLQKELDKFRLHFNNSKPRYDRNKVLPHERPDNIFECLEDFGTVDFSVKVDPNHLSSVRNQFAPPDHFVFDLVPPEFFQLASQFEAEMGNPEVTEDNIWVIYSELVFYFHAVEGQDDLNVALSARSTEPAPPGGLGVDDDEFMPVLDLPPYRNGNQVIGVAVTAGDSGFEGEGTGSAYSDTENMNYSSDGSEEAGIIFTPGGSDNEDMY